MSHKLKVGKVSGIIYNWLIVMAIFLMVAVVLGGLVEIYGFYYRNKIYPGVSVGRLDLGGKTAEQSIALLLAKTDRLGKQGIDFKYEQKTETMKPIVHGADSSGLAYELWSYEIEKIVSKAFAIGREDGGWQAEKEKIKALFGRINFRPEYKLNEKSVLDTLRGKFDNLEKPGKDAKLVFVGDQPEIAAEKMGTVLNYQKALLGLKNNLDHLDNQTIFLATEEDKPAVDKIRAEGLLDEVRSVLSLAPIYLAQKQGTDGEETVLKRWTIGEKKWRQWLKIKEGEVGEVYLGVDSDEALNTLAEIAKEVNQPAKDARFQIQDGRVVEFQVSQDGSILDIDETIKSIEQTVLTEKRQTAALIMALDKSKINNENVNSLGTKELLGRGESDFGGSPVNRRHNIGVGANSLNGLLIKPDEEFSLLTALGEIDASTGYKPELVIREGKTVPEYGGGLCQIGTTFFRLAINAGLPITERRNHSYRVVYYEPAGTDATIYNPWPDFKFINDTGNYLLLQTKVDGNKLFFDFWGTSDKREVATTTPVIYNIVKPGETRIVETEDLKPGVKKCVEKAHNGADAYFKRVVSWPAAAGKEPREDVFRSHYVPWQEVCLIGKEPGGTATSTVESVDGN